MSSEKEQNSWLKNSLRVAEGRRFGESLIEDRASPGAISKTATQGSAENGSFYRLMSGVTFGFKVLAVIAVLVVVPPVIDFIDFSKLTNKVKEESMNQMVNVYHDIERSSTSVAMIPASIHKTIDVEEEFFKLERVLNIKKPKLVEAAISCSPYHVKKLLDSGISLNTRDGRGDTPLIWAAKLNCKPVAKLLIRKGADINASSSNGYTAYRWARQYHSYEVMALLMQSGAGIQ